MVLKCFAQLSEERCSGLLCGKISSQISEERKEMETPETLIRREKGRPTASHLSYFTHQKATSTKHERFRSEAERR